ncbi:MAG: hypothetical protein ACFBRM_14510 [Pikeienuella sp.]
MLWLCSFEVVPISPSLEALDRTGSVIAAPACVRVMRDGAVLAVVEKQDIEPGGRFLPGDGEDGGWPAMAAMPARSPACLWSGY